MGDGSMMRKVGNEYFVKVIYDGHKPIETTGSTRRIAWQAAIEALAEVVGNGQ
jgi:hypothetical protein